MIMPRRPDGATRGAILTTSDARCRRGAVASGAEANRVGVDRPIACADRRIDLEPCVAGCDRPCARQRRALRALLVAIGLAGSRCDESRELP
ncbi:MAG TPA: hypothetical protein VMN78_13325 [Longimicrobiales bacterium]|nr:hypothetical protein [Longimicrobiales bacterium]